MELLEAKILSMVALGLGTIFVGLLPACFTSQGRQQWPMFLSSLLCFGGGVLLSTSIVHILPELRGSLKDYKQYAELIFCAGFFILYVIDEIVHYFYGDTHEANLLNNSNGLMHSHSHGHSHSTSNNSHRRHSTSYGSNERDPLLIGVKQDSYNPSFYKAKSESVLFFENEQAPSQLCHVGHQEPCHAAPTVNIGLLVALSVHALLEGLVVGLENSSSKVLLLLGAVASHKLVVGFCLGVEIASSSLGTFMRHFTFIFIFTIGSIGGIAVGMIISNVPNGINNFVIPVLQGLAGGTLLYVTVSEVLPRERARWHQQHNQRAAGLYQFFSVTLGFVLMTALSKYLDNDN